MQSQALPSPDPSLGVAQTIVWSVQERARMASHQAALELAANVLEAARAQPFDKLDQAWADAQTVPSDMADLVQEGKILVKLEPEKTAQSAKHVKRGSSARAEIRRRIWSSPTAR